MTQNWENMLVLNQENDVYPSYFEIAPCTPVIQHPQTPFSQELHSEQRSEVSLQDSQKRLKTDGKRRKQEWTTEQTLKLQKLHTDLGNKWCSISKHFEQKTQNDVKNHFFSQLRMSLRHLNKIIGKSKSFKMKPIKSGVIYKMISTCDQKHKINSKINSELIKLAFQIKQGLFSFLQTNRENSDLALEVANDLKKFSLMVCRNSKGKKSKSVEEQMKQDKDNGFSISKIFEEEEFQKDDNFLVKDSRTKEDINNDINNEILKENDSSQIMLDESNDVIVRPQICLLNPFEQIKIYCEEEQDPLTLFKREQRQYSPFYLWEEPRQFDS